MLIGSENIIKGDPDIIWGLFYHIMKGYEENQMIEFGKVKSD